MYILYFIPSIATCLCRSAIAHPYIYMYIFSFTPLDLCVLCICWEIVRLLVRYYCTVRTRSTRTLALTSANLVYVTNKMCFDLTLWGEMTRRSKTPSVCLSVLLKQASPTCHVCSLSGLLVTRLLVRAHTCHQR
jgi:hypothetical protein